MHDTPVVIEVALNGATPVERNPHVPQTQARLVEDALACIDAGAAIVHTHAPDITLAGEAGASAYLAHFEPIHAKAPEAILYPTLVWGESIEEKTSHIEPLAAAFPLRVGFVDPGSLNLMRRWARTDCRCPPSGSTPTPIPISRSSLRSASGWGSRRAWRSSSLAS